MPNGLDDRRSLAGSRELIIGVPATTTSAQMSKPAHSWAPSNIPPEPKSILQFLGPIGRMQARQVSQKRTDHIQSAQSRSAFFIRRMEEKVEEGDYATIEAFKRPIIDAIGATNYKGMLEDAQANYPKVQAGRQVQQAIRALMSAVTGIDPSPQAPTAVTPEGTTVTPEIPQPSLPTVDSPRYKRLIEDLSYRTSFGVNAEGEITLNIGPKTMDSAEAEALGNLPAQAQQEILMLQMMGANKFQLREDANTGQTWMEVYDASGKLFKVYPPVKTALTPEQQAIQAGDIAEQQALGREAAVLGKPTTWEDLPTPDLKTRAQILGFTRGEQIPGSLIAAMQKGIKREAQEGVSADVRAREQAKVAVKLGPATKVLSHLRQISDRINTASPGLITRFATGVYRTYQHMSETNVDVATYVKEKKGFMRMIARAFGEVGVLTKQDIDEMAKMFPTVFTTRAVAKQLFKDIETLLSDIARRPPDPAAFQSAEEIQAYMESKSIVDPSRLASELTAIGVGPDVPKINSNESISDYLRRTEGAK